MKYDEFIEYLDEIINYSEIAAEYGLTYTEIDMAINNMKAVMKNSPLPSVENSR